MRKFGYSKEKRILNIYSNFLLKGNTKIKKMNLFGGAGEKMAKIEKIMTVLFAVLSYVIYIILFIIVLLKLLKNIFKCYFFKKWLLLGIPIVWWITFRTKSKHGPTIECTKE